MFSFARDLLNRSKCCLVTFIFATFAFSPNCLTFSQCGVSGLAFLELSHHVCPRPVSGLKRVFSFFCAIFQAKTLICAGVLSLLLLLCLRTSNRLLILFFLFRLSIRWNKWNCSVYMCGPDIMFMMCPSVWLCLELSLIPYFLWALLRPPSPYQLTSCQILSI